MLSPEQQAVLAIMYELDQDDGNRLWYYSDIQQHLVWAGERILPSRIRTAMKALRKLKLVRWGHGQGEDDNFIYGSGHYITREGKSFHVRNYLPHAPTTGGESD